MEPIERKESLTAIKRHVLLVNKNAASTPGKSWLKAYENAAVDDGTEVQIYHLAKLEDLSKAVNKHLAEKDTLLVSVGGDGTLHQLVNVLMRQTEVPIADFRVSCIPAGSGNDWVKTHRIPRKPELAYSTLRDAEYILHDIGQAVVTQRDGSKTTHYYINALGSFIDGWVGYNLQRKIILLPHSLIYWWGLIRSLPTFRYSNSNIVIDNQLISEGYHILANAGICKFAGGGMQLTPHANPTDGKLAITIAGKLSIFQILKAVPLILKGTIEKHPLVKTAFAQSFEIIPSDKHEIYLEADGEYLGLAPAKITVLPAVLKVKSLFKS